ELAAGRARQPAWAEELDGLRCEREPLEQDAYDLSAERRRVRGRNLRRDDEAFTGRGRTRRATGARGTRDVAMRSGADAECDDGALANALDLGHGPFDVARVVVATADDDEVLLATAHVELAALHVAKVTGSKPTAVRTDAAARLVIAPRTGQRKCLGG